MGSWQPERLRSYYFTFMRRKARSSYWGASWIPFFSSSVMRADISSTGSAPTWRRRYFSRSSPNSSSAGSRASVTPSAKTIGTSPVCSTSMPSSYRVYGNIPPKISMAPRGGTSGAADQMGNLRRMPPRKGSWQPERLRYGLSHAGLILQYAGLIRGFPRKRIFGPPEVAEGGRLAVDGTPQAQRVDDGARGQQEVRPHQ